MTRRKRSVRQNPPAKGKERREPASPSSDPGTSLVDLVRESPARQQELQQMIVHYSGPLPHPEMLRQYDEIVPGFAETLRDNWRDQTEHRMAIEKMAVEAEIRHSSWGIIAGVIVAGMGFGTAAFMAYIGAETAAIVIGGTPIISLVGTFVYGTRSRAKERQEKQEMMTRSQRQ